jgi:glycosyltransferase involved in cell wall biosynthesis
MKNLETVILNKKNITDFAGERNLLLKKAKSEWVFFVDSDETVSPGLKKEIDERLSSQSADKFNGYYIYRKNFFLGENAGTDKILRLGRKNAGRWKRKVHEIWEIKGNIGQLRNPLVHNTAINLHDFINKINLYSTLHGEENLESGKKSNIIKIIFYPIFKFIQSIIIGRGFMMSMLQSFHSFLAWSKEWKLQNA